MKHDKDSMNWQRRILAVLGVLLPILAPLFGLLAYSKNGPTFWYSISATFYASSNILMIGILTVFAFFLYCYQGYDIGDKFTTTFSASMAIGILIFPCNCAAADTTVGILNIPVNISNIIHCTVAALLFASFAYMIGFRFTKSNYKGEKISNKKKLRNKIFYGCAGIIVLFMLNQVVTSILDIGWMTIVNEAIMLWSFSFAWAVKAGTFKKFND